MKAAVRMQTLTVLCHVVLNTHESAEDSGPCPSRHIPLLYVSWVCTYVRHSAM